MTGASRGTHYLNTYTQSFLDLFREFRIQARKELNDLLWTGKERTSLFVRPFVSFRECNCKASGTLIIAVWHPAPSWLKSSLTGVNSFLLSSLAGWIVLRVKKVSLLASVTAFGQRGSRLCSARFEHSILPFLILFCPLDIFSAFNYLICFLVFCLAFRLDRSFVNRYFGIFIC